MTHRGPISFGDTVYTPPPRRWWEYLLPLAYAEREERAWMGFVRRQELLAKFAAEPTFTERLTAHRLEAQARHQEHLARRRTLRQRIAAGARRAGGLS